MRTGAACEAWSRWLPLQSILCPWAKASGERDWQSPGKGARGQGSRQVLCGPPPVLGAKRRWKPLWDGWRARVAPTRSSPRALCVWRQGAERWREGGRAGKVRGGSLLPGWRLLGYSQEPCPCPHPQKSPEFAVDWRSFQRSPQRKRFLFSHSPTMDSRICGRYLSVPFQLFWNSSFCRHLPSPSPTNCMSSVISFPEQTPVVYFMLLSFLNFLAEQSPQLPEL